MPGSLKKVMIFAMLLGIVMAIGWGMRELLTWETVLQRDRQLRNWRDQSPVVTLCLAFLGYVVVSWLGIPGFGILSVAYGWYLGFLRAVLLVSCASTLGATLAFLVSRYLLRDVVQRNLSQRFHRFYARMDQQGPWYLMSLRLFPGFPFALINLAAGLTSMRLRTYWWISQVGMLPGTAAYVYVGVAAPDPQQLARQGIAGILTWPFIISLMILATLPWAMRVGARLWKQHRKGITHAGSDEA